MLRQDHYNAAEKALDKAEDNRNLARRDNLIARAQVHATLATATKEIDKLANPGVEF